MKKSELRQLVKAIVLAVPYGAGAGQIAKLLKIEYMEADFSNSAW